MNRNQAHSILSSTRGAGGDGRRAPAPAPTRDVRVGAGSYGDGETKSYTDPKGVGWVIQDNGCDGFFDGFSCDSILTDNRFWATERVSRYEHAPYIGLKASTLDAVKVLVDKYSAMTDLKDGGGSSDSSGGGGGGGTFDDGGEDAPKDPSADGAVRPPKAKPLPPIPAYSGTMPSDASLSSIQRALIGLGYSVGSTGADGKPGPSTDAAIIKFKQAHGVSPADAAITPAFRNALSKAVAARNGASIVDSAGGTSLTWIFVAATVAAVAGVVVKKWIG